MLEHLRDKILNVQHDLSASFRNLATGDSQSRSKKHSYKGISLNAGADLLCHYQQQWEELHTGDAGNAKKAEEVDVIIGHLHSYCTDRLSVIRQLNTQLCALPQLQTGILDLMSKIGELEGMFEEVEDALLNLEDVIETQELQETQLDHRFQLAMYKEKKLTDYENSKAKYAINHAQKVFDFEAKQEQILKERQNTFQEVFEEELQEYKAHGMKQLRTRISSGGSVDRQVSLEDIDLGEDKAALDEFLEEKPQETDPQTTTSNEET